MGLYELGWTPFMTVVTSRSETMDHSSINLFYNVAFADDFTGCGKIESLKQWFGEISFRRTLCSSYQDTKDIFKNMNSYQDDVRWQETLRESNWHKWKEKYIHWQKNWRIVQRNRHFVNYCSNRTSRSLGWIYIRLKT